VGSSLRLARQTFFLAGTRAVALSVNRGSARGNRRSIVPAAALRPWSAGRPSVEEIRKGANLTSSCSVLPVMRGMWLLLVSIALVASACDSGEADRLRGALDAARSQAATAEKAAHQSERARQSTAEQLDQMREQLAQPERPGEGLVMSIPLVGRLTWACNDDREFSFTFTPEQATITVEQSIEGEITRRQLDPGEELTSRFLRVDVQREWTVIYRHKPGTISARISVEPAVSGGACFIRNSTLEQNRRSN
jgi:hypothetical protein